ncbi:FTR1 family iron permease [Alteromonas gilva]|uniref:FTR1 family iron permease n=1 Tax=Alteromonas gilva TaxID=2987522 RepID=A0ABT5KWZ6_9ALTE|nr:FTR1 family iron permease [Alteromonas gilva]MDC8829276.1 FTR1 family iron permease [Alteromonas gilva]
MLINTVILFIRDTLPVFLMLSLLLAQQGASFWHLLSGTVVGWMLALALYFNLAAVSALFDGGGLELIKSAVLLLLLCGLCLFLERLRGGQSAQAQRLSFVLMTGLTLVNAIHFLVYIVAYWSAPKAGTAMIVGNVIGLGISMSVGVLLYVLTKALAIVLLQHTLLTVFVAGQVAGIALLLEQINLLPNQTRLWDTSGWVADDSEYGHFLNALMGYEATPTGAYVMIYVCSVLLPVLYCYVRATLKDVGSAAREVQ